MGSDIKGLFINNKKAQDSIYESGVMVFDCLRLSKKFTLDYFEIDVENRTIPTGYAFYFFNYHPYTMPWLETSLLKKLDGPVITMVLEVLPGDPFVMCPKRHFDYYCVLDPSLRSKRKNVIAFPRPLEIVEVETFAAETTFPVIGSFGFATRGKGFQHVVDAVNKEFDKALVRINIPHGSFVPDSEEYSRFLEKVCKERAKVGVDVIVTHDYMSKAELIKWCSANTLNCFLYDRNMPGLAATTDQAIVSGRPLAVSRNDTFRHILSYLSPYPEWNLRKSIDESATLVNKMREDWSPQNFSLKFEGVVESIIQSNKRPRQGQQFVIPIKQNRLQDRIRRLFLKIRQEFSVWKINKRLPINSSRSNEELI